MKRWQWLRISALPALLLTALLANCSDLGTLPADRLLGPDEASLAKSDKGEKVKKEKKEKAPKVKGTKRSGEISEWELGYGTLPDQKDLQSKKVIDGSTNEWLSAGGHYLFVPAGAVTEPTEFKMALSRKKLETGDVVVAVSLRATRTDPVTGEEIDVGAQGFGGKEVQLFLTTEWTKNRPSKLTSDNSAVLWLKPVLTASKEVSEVEDSYVAEEVEGFSVLGGYVVGRLKHFSDYALAFPF